MYSIRSIAKFAVLTPIIVILLTIGWYQQAIQHINIPENTLLPDIQDNSYIIAGYFINWLETY
jgi:hypothetical protein